MFDRIILGSEANKDLLCVPVKEWTEVCVDIKVDLNEVLNVAIHMPCCFTSNDLKLVDDDGP